MVYVDGGSTHPRSTHVHSHLYKLNGNDSDVEHGIALNFFSSTYSIKPNATHCTSSTEIPGEAWARKHVYSRWIKIKKIFSFFHHLQQYIIIKFIESVKIWLSEQLQPSMKWMESGMSALASSLLATSNTNMFALMPNMSEKFLQNKVHRTFVDRRATTIDLTPNLIQTK